MQVTKLNGRETAAVMTVMGQILLEPEKAGDILNNLSGHLDDLGMTKSEIDKIMSFAQYIADIVIVQPMLLW